MKQIFLTCILKNKSIWLLAIAYFFVYIVRTAVNDWSVLFLVEEKGYSLIVAGSCVFCFEIGGIFGSLSAGFLSDKLFKGKRGPVNILYGFLATLAVVTFWISPSLFPLVDSALMFMIGFMIFGPQMLIGIAAAELSSKKAAGSATGFIGLFAYIGAATAGLPLGLMAQYWGWRGFFITLTICAAVAVLFLLPLWSKSKPKIFDQKL